MDISGLLFARAYAGQRRLPPRRYCIWNLLFQGFCVQTISHPSGCQFFLWSEQSVFALAAQVHHGTV